MSSLIRQRAMALATLGEWRAAAAELGLKVMNEPNNGPHFAIFTPEYVGAGALAVKVLGPDRTELWGARDSEKWGELDPEQAFAILWHMHVVHAGE